MALFDRIRRSGAPGPVEVDDAPSPYGEPLPADIAPQVNDRVALTVGDSRATVPTRVEDLDDGQLVLAEPGVRVEPGDSVVLGWERDAQWYSLRTSVVGIDEWSPLPTIRVAAAGPLDVHDDRRRMQRRRVELPLRLLVSSSQAVARGRQLDLVTSEASGNAIRFSTSAPFAPGDIVEARIRVGEGDGDVISGQLRVLRVDVAGGSWRQLVTATIQEMLRADRARLAGVVETVGSELEPNAPLAPLEPPVAAGDGAPTADGVGGRDEPESLGTLQDAVGWLRRRGTRHDS